MRLLIAARNAEIAIDDGRICEPVGRFDLELKFPDACVFPGLINAHDHLHRNHYGRLGGQLYHNPREWADDVRRRFGDRIAIGQRKARCDALLVGAWKNLFAGVTAVVHHDPWEKDFDCSFPLRVAPIPSADNVAFAEALEPLDRTRPYAIHVAEGIDASATEDVRRLDALGLVTDKLIAVHAVGVDDDGIASLAAAGSALAWCPSSNMFLYGRTAPQALLSSGIDVLLGSDSLLSGIGDLLDELRFARSLEMLSDQRLTESVGQLAAKRLGIAAPTLEQGADANLFVCSNPILDASSRDVALVVAGGHVRVAAPDLAPRLDRLSPGGRLMMVGGVERWTSGQTAAPDRSVAGEAPTHATIYEEKLHAGIR